MTIYASLHTIGSQQITGLSVDSGFTSLDEVTEKQQGEIIPGHQRCVTYKIDNDTSLIFSDFPFYTGDIHENV